MRKKNFASLQQTPIEKLKRFPVSHTHTHTHQSHAMNFPKAQSSKLSPAQKLDQLCAGSAPATGNLWGASFALIVPEPHDYRFLLGKLCSKQKKSSKNWMKKMHFSCFVVRSIINQIMARARFCDTFFTSAPRGAPLSLATKKNGWTSGRTDKLFIGTLSASKFRAAAAVDLVVICSEVDGGEDLHFFVVQGN